MHPYLKLIRPHQWLKNLMIFFPPFLAGNILNISPSLSLFTFLTFSLTASSTYVLNDILDREADKHHPKKRFRPVSSGKITIFTAQCLCGVLIVFALVIAWLKVATAMPWLIAYVVLSLAYTFYLKKMMVVDLVAIASFFLIRLYAGGFIFEVNISLWLFLSVFLLSLFLSTGKRLGELQVLGSVAADHRPSLALYTSGWLNSALYATALVVLVTYVMYCIEHRSLLITVPLCCYGLVRYICRVQKGHDGDPTSSLLCDNHLLIVSACWALVVSFVIYA